MRSWKLAATAIAVAALAGAGIAYANIPGGGNVYTACMLKNVGTVRLIDPTLPASNLMSHCTSLETQMSWNQQGQPGTPGSPGQDGASVVMGDAGANCANGGVSLTVGSATRYVCNGANGADGQNGTFTGHFESPNGQYSIDVANGGIDLLGPNGMVHINSTGITATSGTTLKLRGSGGVELRSDSLLDIIGAGTTSVTGSLLRLNGCSGGVTRVGDLVTVNPDSGIGFLTVGSPTVCSG
ncbi:MAG TPA: hypothetical protein VLK24_06910 [Gaiellaceae bacterium]|nr:hypothetical protein [Gaiellaceae bacterium]